MGAEEVHEVKEAVRRPRWLRRKLHTATAQSQQRNQYTMNCSAFIIRGRPFPSGVWSKYLFASPVKPRLITYLAVPHMVLGETVFHDLSSRSVRQLAPPGHSMYIKSDPSRVTYENQDA